MANTAKSFTQFTACNSLQPTDVLIISSNVSGNTITMKITANNLFTNNAVDTGKPIAFKSANATLANTESGYLIVANSAANLVITIANQSSGEYLSNSNFEIVRYNTGNVTFANAAGVTLNSTNNDLTISERYDVVKLVRINEDEWLLTGNLLT